MDLVLCMTGILQIKTLDVNAGTTNRQIGLGLNRDGGE